MAPLADRIRPQTLDEVVGQKHILGKDKVLRRIIESGNVPNLIFYGPSGVGKTTVARIIAQGMGKELYSLNATTASVSDIKAIAKDLDGFGGQEGVVLYLDEIQNFNKKQQQSLLEHIENGSITLIASTTENPYFYIYNAILSRSIIFEFYPITAEDIKEALLRAADCLKKEYGIKRVEMEPKALEHLANSAYGDVRKAMNLLEACAIACAGGDEIHITVQTAADVTAIPATRYDRDGDSHYDLLSAFQKSIRGTDENAALHYLARLLSAGDIKSVCRRLLVIAAEDIGLAYPNAMPIVKACTDAALQLGLPEGRLPLAEAVLLLATAPKSNSVICAMDAAMQDLNQRDTGDVPQHLKDAHYKGAAKMGRGKTYQYPHNFPGHYIKQQYLPDNLREAVYYQPGENKYETSIRSYLEKLRKQKT